MFGFLGQFGVGGAFGVGAMPRPTVSEFVVTEPDRARIQHLAVFLFTAHLSRGYTLGDLQVVWVTSVALCKAGSFDGVPRTEEPIQRRLIAQDPNHNTWSLPHHATGDQNEAVHEPSKFHPNVGVSILLQVQHHGQPRFEVPSQSDHNHIGPVANKVVDRKPHRMDAVLELLDDVFLITPLIGAINDFGYAQIGARGDVEEIADLIEQDILALHLADVLAKCTTRYGRVHLPG